MNEHVLDSPRKVYWVKVYIVTLFVILKNVKAISMFLNSLNYDAYILHKISNKTKKYDVPKYIIMYPTGYNAAIKTNKVYYLCRYYV